MAPKLKRGDLIAGRYRLEELLGEGGYGSVWKAVQLNLNRPVAIKFLKTFVADPSATARFDREAKALARLQHPHCLTLLDFGFDGGAFLVTEFVSGPRLDEWAEGKPSHDDILLVTRQILDALSYAHGQKIVHRDLKPPNIIITRNLEGGLHAKVLDFGIASVVGARRGDITKTGEVFGTPGYMSPEQLLGQTNVGPPADLYSVGVMVFQIFEGGRLFDGKMAIEIAMKHLSIEAPRMTVAAPPGVADVVERLLKKDPDERYQSAHEVMRALPEPGMRPPPEWVGSTASGARPVADYSPSQDGFRRPPHPQTTDVSSGNNAQLAGVAALLVAVALVLGAVVWSAAGDEETPVRRPGVRAASQLWKSTTPAGARPTKRPASEAMGPDAGADRDEAPISRRTAGCGASVSGAGLMKVEAMLDVLESDSAIVWVPDGYDPNVPHPVVMLFHDAGQKPVSLIEEIDFGELADRDQVILVASEHDTIIFPWNDPSSWAAAGRDLEVVSKVLCVDRRQIYLFGYGAGGHAAEQLSCRLDGIRGAAVAAHRLAEDDKPCPHADIPYMFLAPMKDGRDPVRGGVGCLAGEDVVSVEEHERVYAEIQGCDGERKLIERYKASKCFAWEDCASPFISCHIDGGRPFPGSKHRVAECEGRAADFPYREKIWDFFMTTRLDHEPSGSPEGSE